MKKIVRIEVENHHYNGLLKQLDKNSIFARQFNFTTQPVGECDYLIVLEFPKRNITCKVPLDNVWVWSMEPPDEEWEWIRKCYKYFSRIITIDKKIQHPKFIQNQLGIPWQIEFDYNQLAAMNVFGSKNSMLSFMASNYDARKGHRKRLKFLNDIEGKLEFDLYGRGFNTIEKKSVALLPYKYSIVVENSSYPDYWSEKLADAFLCGVLPFYYGCKNIEDYFDPETFVRIDINKPGEAIQIIKRVIKANEWEKRKTTIDKARHKILDEYQFFPVLVKLIEKYGNDSAKPEDVQIPVLHQHSSSIRPLSPHRIYYRLKKFFLKNSYNNPESPLFGYTTYK